MGATHWSVSIPCYFGRLCRPRHLDAFHSIQCAPGGNYVETVNRESTRCVAAVVGMLQGPVLPAVMRGQRYGGMVHQVDWYPTLLKLAGVSDAVLNRSGVVPVDGVDQRDAFFAGRPSRRTTLVHNINGNRPGAIRMGKYKFFKGYPGAKGEYNAFDGWWAPPEMGGTVVHPTDGQLCETSNCLFDLSTDPGERTDVSAAHPEIVQKMLALYAKLQRTEITPAAAGLCNTSSAIPDGCDANRARGVWEPWMPDIS
eukprot:m.374939 g.374939  ORF g.374939 m.374939 type:complete len:255 (-) comp20910_c0_seq10:404-1168(-)